MKRKAPIRAFLLTQSGLTAESLAMAFDDGEIRLRGASAVLAKARADLAGDHEVGNGSGAVDLVLIDTAEREAWALEAVRRLAEENPGLKLLPFGIADEKSAVAFLEAGASGYSMRSDSLAATRRTIRAVADGEPPCTPRITALIHSRLVELSRRAVPRAASATTDAGLSRREREVLGLLAHGRRNKEIARDLGIALSTAGKHVQRVLSKLQVHRRRDAIRRAYEHGLLEGAPPFVAA